MQEPNGFICLSQHYQRIIYYFENTYPFRMDVCSGYCPIRFEIPKDFVGNQFPRDVWIWVHMRPEHTGNVSIGDRAADWGRTPESEWWTIHKRCPDIDGYRIVIVSATHTVVYMYFICNFVLNPFSSWNNTFMCLKGVCTFTETKQWVLT